jgi:ADP-ribosylglycohydrolase
MPAKKQISASLYGHVVGDALGAPVEFEPRKARKAKPVTDMIGYGTFNLPAGSWTDDTSMTLALAKSIGDKGTYNANDVCKNFSRWLERGEFAVFGKAFGVGRTCYGAILNYWRTKEIRIPAGCAGRWTTEMAH